jgi:hypothetical protein
MGIFFSPRMVTDTLPLSWANAKVIIKRHDTNRVNFLIANDFLQNTKEKTKATRQTTSTTSNTS